MKKIQNLGILCLVALGTTVSFWASSILSSELFIPYVMATVFTGVFFIASFMVQNKEKMLTTICTMAISIILFVIARWLDTQKNEFYYSQSWDGCEHTPALAIITWGWQIQIILTCAWGWVSWKYYDTLAKISEEKPKESTGSRL